MATSTGTGTGTGTVSGTATVTAGHASGTVVESVGSAPLVMYIGPPKTGSSSFHSLMTHLSLPSFHVGGPGLLDVLTQAAPSLEEAYAADEVSCRSHGRTVFGPMPDKHITQLIGRPAIDCMLETSGYHSFSDDPWPLLYRHVDRNFPTTRFIMWARDPADWARSFVRFFRDFDDTRWLRLAYGLCNVTEEQEPLLQDVMRQHVEQVRAYFASSSDASRRSRLLVIEDINAPGLPHALCAFALANTSQSWHCSQLSGMPHILPPTSQLGYKDSYNLPLGRPADISAWRSCVSSRQSGSLHGSRRLRR